MKDPQTYIDSGVLELFVYGILPEEEMVEVAHIVAQNPVLLQEVISIENSLMKLASAAAPAPQGDADQERIEIPAFLRRQAN